MSNWLMTVRTVLDEAEKPVRLFFRDDDAGWVNDRLYLLLDKFAYAGLPIDVAVIPRAINHHLVDELLLRWQQDGHLIGLHQHGYGHLNHESAGRRCEFGGSRSKTQQKVDISKGQVMLRAALGNALEPHFTPPWNRCTAETVECLEELDFHLLSRDVTAAQLESSKLKQVPVHTDWSKILKTSSTPLATLGEAIAAHIGRNAVTGIMLHHADMDAESLKPLAELLAVLAGHSNVQGIRLRDTLKYGTECEQSEK